MRCTAHRLGLDWECRDENCGASEEELHEELSSESEPEVETEVEQLTYKDDSALKDQQSTGRKRAARWFPLDETAPCEWSGKTNCGGGKFPITGCENNLQQARHHGPDKNTLNNEKGNVHRICHTCHNRWHTLNDDGYVWGAVHDEHAPKLATPEDFKKSAEFWEGRKIVRAKD